MHPSVTSFFHSSPFCLCFKDKTSTYKSFHSPFKISTIFAKSNLKRLFFLGNDIAPRGSSFSRSKMGKIRKEKYMVCKSSILKYSIHSLTSRWLGSKYSDMSANIEDKNPGGIC